MVLGWIIGGLLTAAAITAIVIYINGKITKEKLEEEFRKRDIKMAIAKEINKCTNTMTFEDFENNTYEVHGDSIDDDIEEGDVIWGF